MALKNQKPQDQNQKQHTPPTGPVFYHDALMALNASAVPYLLGGGYALYARTGIARMTKDLDLFMRRDDVPKALQVLEETGYETEVTSDYWLAKAFCGDDFIDIIFNSGNGCCPVDDRWFEHAPAADVLGVTVKLCPLEESIWQKAFIMERERFDGADVIHLLRACGDEVDWDRLLERFGPHWRLLLAHLVLLEYVYPDSQSVVPRWVMDGLTHRLRQGRDGPSSSNGRTCFGTLLSRRQYEMAVNDWGYADARCPPVGLMTREEVDRWTRGGPPAREHRLSSK